MRQVVKILVVLLAAGTLLNCATSPKEGSPVSIRIGSPFREGHILVDAAQRFKELIEQETGGRIRVTLMVGTDSEEVINARNSRGEIEMQSNGHRALEEFAPQYFFFNAPYVMKDWDHFMRVWNGRLGERARAEVVKNGNVKYIGIVYRGLRQTTANRPLMTPADVSGLRLRLPTVKTWIAVWREMGADPVPIPLPQLYDALRDGRAVASEGDLTQIKSFRLFEVQSHLMLTNHLVQTGGIMIHKPFLDSLSKADQRLVLRFAKEAAEFTSNKLQQTETAILDTLRQRMTVVTPNAEAFRARGKPAVEQLFRTDWPVTTWEEVLAQ